MKFVAYPTLSLFDLRGVVARIVGLGRREGGRNK